MKRIFYFVILVSLVSCKNNSAFEALKQRADEKAIAEEWEVALNLYESALDLKMDVDVVDSIESITQRIEKLQSIASETSEASTTNEPKIVSNTSKPKPISSTKPASKSSYNSSSLNFCKSAIEKFKYSEFSNLGGISNRWRYTDYYTYAIVGINDCVLELEETMKHITSQNTTRNDYTVKYKVNLNLSDLKSVEYVANKGFVLKTVNSVKTIQKTLSYSSNYTVTNATTTAYSEFIIKAKEFGEYTGKEVEFANSLNSMIKSCGGGKGESF